MRTPFFGGTMATRIERVLLALTLVACGGGEQQTPPSIPPVVAIAIDAAASDNPGEITLSEASHDGGVDAAPPLPPSFPPAKATTIALSSGANGPVDKELTAGDAAFESGSMDEAKRHYEAARVAGPKRAGPLVGLARVRIANVGVPMDFAIAKGNKEITAAVADLKTATKREVDFGPAYVELGRAELLLGNADAALDALRRGVSLLDAEAEAHEAFGVALLATGHGEQALTELARAVQIDPGSAARHGNYGTALFMRGRVKEAITEYEAEVSLADGDARAHSDLGTALLAQNDGTRAVAELRRAIAIDPGRATFHSNLGYALQLMGNVDDAIAEYNTALKLDDKLVSAWINLATALAKRPATRKDARAALERAKKIDPTDPRVKPNLDELDDLEKDAGRSP
jgi:tetratricopeptide (TPR) repeat protein